MSGNSFTLGKHVLHPFGLLERFGRVAVELDTDRPLSRGDESELRRVGADGRRLGEAVPGARALERVREDAALAVVDRLVALAVAHGDGVDDVLPRVRGDRIGRDVEEVSLRALADLGPTRRSTVDPGHEQAEGAGKDHRAAASIHDW